MYTTGKLRLCYVFVEANINEQNQIFITEIFFVGTTVHNVECAYVKSINPFSFTLILGEYTKILHAKIF